MTTALAPRPYLQVHPSRRCQLSCAHCYTSSGPGERAALPADLVARAVRDAAGLGYAELAISGGEPLLYPGLEQVLSAGRAAGLTTSFTTNGLALTRRRLERLGPLVDLVAVSVDGVPASHDALRGSARAFSTLLARLPLVRAAGVPLGIITTLTLANAHELPWLVGFAAKQDAALLQVHPLDGQGRATEGLLGARPDAVELAAALVVARLLAPPGLDVHVDAVLRAQLAAWPERFCATGVVGTGDLGSWLPSLVVEPDGTVVPLTYGMDRRFALGNLADAPLPDLAACWLRTSAPAFAEAVRLAHQDVLATGAEVVFWFEALAQAMSRRREGADPGAPLSTAS